MHDGKAIDGINPGDLKEIKCFGICCGVCKTTFKYEAVVNLKNSIFSFLESKNWEYDEDKYGWMCPECSWSK